MALKLQSKKEDLSKADLKTLAISSAPLILLVVLAIFSFRFVFSRITEQREAFEISKVAENVLTQKYDLLSSFENQTATLIDSVSVAIPHKDASLMMIAQLKNTVSGKSIFLSNLKSGSSAIEKNNLIRYEVQFDVDGPLTEVLSYLESLSLSAPLSRLDSIDLNTAGSSARASIVLSVFSASLPTKIPALTDSLSDLSQSELEVIERLSRLVPPPFIEVDIQEAQAPRNPFN